MRIYRGPRSKPFSQATHEHVATLKPDALEKGIKEKSRMTFNVSKEGNLREAVCTALFEDDDLIPVANGLLARLALQQSAIGNIKKIIQDGALSNEAKISNIKVALRKLK